MTNKELGRIIREARLAKKMTQKEVVGNQITRNMLSQIENGQATPSIRTLQYLAERLDLSYSLFEKDIAPEEKADASAIADITLWEEMKSLYLQQNYDACIRELKPLLTEQHPQYDESCALAALCYLALAKESMEQNDRPAAASFAGQAVCYCSLGIFQNRQVLEEALSLLAAIST